MVLSVEVAEDSRVVVRAHSEGATSEVATLLKGRASTTLTEDLKQRSVVCLRRNDDNVLKVLRCPTDEADTADIDLLDDIFFAGARGYRSFEGIEVYDHQVDEG